jgi:hypothetical protein
MFSKFFESQDLALFNDVRPVFVKLRENAFLLMPTCYGVVLILWYAYHGVLFSFSLGLVFLALLPLTLLLGRTAQFVKELTPFIVLLMSYEGTGSSWIPDSQSGHSSRWICGLLWHH